MNVSEQRAAGMDVFTGTRVGGYNKCRRYEFLASIARLRSDTSKQALRMGSAFHLGQELLSRSLKPAMDPEERSRIEDEAVLSAIQEYNNSPPPPGVTPLDWSVEREIVGRMLRAYAWRWSNETLDVVHAELPFKLPARDPLTGQQLFRVVKQKVGPPLKMLLWRAGVIDKIVRLPDGRTAILEHKTTGDSIEDRQGDYWRIAKMSPQGTNYLDAAWELEYKPDTILWDVIRKPSIEPKKLTVTETREFLGLASKKGKKVIAPDLEKRFVYNQEVFSETVIEGTVDLEDPANTKIERVIVDGQVAELTEQKEGYAMRETPTMFGARLMNDMLSRPDFYFAREEVPRLQGDLDEYRNDVCQTIQMHTFNVQRDAWPRDTRACLMPYKCEFFRLCANNVQVTVDGEPPEGFRRLEYIHPELEGKI